MKKKIFLTLLAIIVFILIDTVFFDTYLDKNVDNAQIEEAIKEHCDCEFIKNEISGQGISIADNVYGDYHTFRLVNCKFDNFEEYLENLNRKLKVAIPNFCEADLVKLNFEFAANENRIVNIRNCELKIVN